MVRQTGLTALLALVLAASATAAITGWQVVKSGSASGQFAIKSITATVNHPAGIEVRLSGGASNGNAVISCTKGFSSVASWSRTWSHAGTYRMPMTRGANSCLVVAAVGGSGRVTVQILAYR